MLARFRVLLPYHFCVPYHDYVRQKPHELQYEEYRVRLYPPRMANVDSSVTDVTSPIPLMDAVNQLEEKMLVTPIAAIRINGQEVVRANLLQVDLIAARDYTRNRRGGDVFDPPLDLFFKLVNSVIARLKSVGRMANAKFVDLDAAAAWKIEYLTDEGQQLPRDEALFRKRTGNKVTWQVSAMPAGIWDLALTLPTDFTLPVWHNLILDASAQLPDVNTSIVLANAALESFIKLSLDILAKGSSISPESWEWITSRENTLLKQPSAKEMFDQALFLLTGKSLRKDQPELWKAFDDLRAARNSMVHQGKAVIKKKTRKGATTIEVTTQTAEKMVENASRIITWVESLLPDEHKRVMFKGNINFSVARSATGSEGSNTEETEIVGIRGDLSRIKVGIGHD